MGGVLRNWGLAFVAISPARCSVALLMAIVFTYGFSTDPDPVGKMIAGIGVARTLGYAQPRRGRHVHPLRTGHPLQLDGLHRRGGRDDLHHVNGKVLAMWMPIMVFFYMTFEHSVVNMFLFPSGLMMGGKFSIADYFIWNEIPTVLGNLVGGLTFTGRDAVHHPLEDGAGARDAAPRGALRRARAPSRGPERAGVRCSHAGQLQVSLGQHSDKGRKETNQDFHGALLPERAAARLKGIALALADGISTSAVSQVASQSAVRGFLEDYYCTSDAWSVRTRRARAERRRTPGCTRRRARASPLREGQRLRLHVQRADAEVHAPRTCSMPATRASTGCVGAPLSSSPRTTACGCREEPSYLSRALGVSPISRSTTAPSGGAGRYLPARHRRRAPARRRALHGQRDRDHAADLDAAARAIVSPKPSSAAAPTTSPCWSRASMTLPSREVDEVLGRR